MAREAEQRVAALPGVASVVGACCLPLTSGPDLPFAIVGRAPDFGPFNGDVQYRNVSPQFFEVFRIPVQRGRALTDRDDAESTPVA